MGCELTMIQSRVQAQQRRGKAGSVSRQWLRMRAHGVVGVSLASRQRLTKFQKDPLVQEKDPLVQRSSRRRACVLDCIQSNPRKTRRGQKYVGVFSTKNSYYSSVRKHQIFTVWTCIISAARRFRRTNAKKHEKKKKRILFHQN